MKTPTGTLKVVDKIGSDFKEGTILSNDKNNGTKAEIYKDNRDISNDQITSRIIHLGGLEKNNTNTYNRHIYFHGTPEEGLLLEKKPSSHGCIRMLNKDVIELYDNIKEGTLVEILNT